MTERPTAAHDLPVPQDMEAVRQLVSALELGFAINERDHFHDEASDVDRWEGMLRWLQIMRVGLKSAGFTRTIPAFEHISSTIFALAYRKQLPVPELTAKQVQPPKREFEAELIGVEAARMLIVAKTHFGSQNKGAKLVADVLKLAGFRGRRGSIGPQTVVDWLLRHEAIDATFRVDENSAKLVSYGIRTDADLKSWIESEAAFLRRRLQKFGLLSKVNDQPPRKP